MCCLIRLYRVFFEYHIERMWQLIKSHKCKQPLMHQAIEKEIEIEIDRKRNPKNPYKSNIFVQKEGNKVTVRNFECQLPTIISRVCKQCFYHQYLETAMLQLCVACYYLADNASLNRFVILDYSLVLTLKKSKFSRH